MHSMEFLFLVLGLAGLWLGSELTIRGALDIAERHKISQLFIGLTILALGTDLPELFINIGASIQRLQGTETSGLIIGETIGTSMGQFGFVLGVATFFGTIVMTKREFVRDGMTMLGAILLLFIVGQDGELSRIDGAIFIVIYVLYFISLFREEKLFNKLQRAPQLHLFWAIVSLLGGFVLLIAGSQMTIDNALLVSERFGIAQHVVGILIVGLGTSLPELATAITAVRKGAGTMAAGNLIGSNIFDILVTLGIGSMISGFAVDRHLLYFDVPVLFFFSFAVLMLFRRKMRFDRMEGFIALGMYFAYFAVRALDLV